MKFSSSLQKYGALLISLAPFDSSLAGSCEELAGSTEPISGFVFEDRNRNSLMDDGETGISNVSVSNGCDVTVTDADGFYQSALAPGQILFISQPATHSVPVDESQVPQFYYIHYPEGSPSALDGHPIEWRFPVIEPTGPLPERIDFPLYKLETVRSEFTAHAFADTQAKTEIDQDMLREDLVNTLVGNPYGAQFTLTVGDVVFDNLDLYDRHKEMMALIDIPNWYLPGNHDVNFESPDAYLANETYKKHFGPTYYSFNWGKVHVVALNNVEYAGAEARRTGEGRPYRGFISDDQIRWLEQDLSRVPRDRLIVIATHIPLIAEATDGQTVFTGPETENFDRLLKLLQPFKNIYGLAGHDTSNSWKVEVNHSHGWHGQPWIAHTLAEARGAGWHTGPKDLRGVADAMMDDGNPNGFYLLKFNDHSIIPEFIPFPFGNDATQRLRILLEPELVDPSGTSIHRGHLNPNTKVVVNLFDGGARDLVSLSLDGSPYQSLRYVIRTDPFVARARSRLPEMYNKSGETEPSTHIWEYELPSNLKPGIHKIDVTAIDEFGQKRHGVFTFELLGGRTY